MPQKQDTIKEITIMASNILVPIVKEFVSSHSWVIQKEQNNTVIITNGKGLMQEVDHILIISAQDEIHDLTILVLCCERVPSHKRMRMAEYLARATLSLILYVFTNS